MALLLWPLGHPHIRIRRPVRRVRGNFPPSLSFPRSPPFAIRFDFVSCRCRGRSPPVVPPEASRGGAEPGGAPGCARERQGARETARECPRRLRCVQDALGNAQDASKTLQDAPRQSQDAILVGFGNQNGANLIPKIHLEGILC